MKKKIVTLTFVVILCFAMMIPAFAENGFVHESGRVIDNASLLSDSEIAALSDKLDEISVRQLMDIIVYTTDSLGGYEVSEYADNVYDQNSFGYGDTKDGLLLLICPQSGDWYISTCGYGITTFTDAGIEYIGKQITPYLSDGDFSAAFEAFAQYCDDFITQARNDKPYDNGNLPKEPLSLIWIPISIAVGIFLAFVVVGKMKSELKSVSKKREANSYVRNGSLNIIDNREYFLYNKVDRTPRPKENSSSGSSTHTSSSGTTHGGGGGKF